MSFSKLPLAIFLLGGMQVSSMAHAQLVANGNFEAGNTGFTTGYADIVLPTLINGAGQYTIGPDPSAVSVFGDWKQFGDHTSGHGNMLIANGATAANTNVWSETITLQPNTNYVFSYWGATVNQTSGSQTVLQPVVNSASVGSALTLPVLGGSFVQNSVNYFSGANTTAVFSIVDTDTDDAYNDFALDDISLTPSSTSTPEPGSMALVASLGITGAGFLVRRRRHTRKAA